MPRFILLHFFYECVDIAPPAAVKRVRRVAPDAAQRTTGQAHKHRRPADATRLALQRVENFGDAQTFGSICAGLNRHDNWKLVVCNDSGNRIRHSREGGNPASSCLKKQRQRHWITRRVRGSPFGPSAARMFASASCLRSPAFAGMTAKKV